jgi:Uncharacterized conserved protein
MRTVAYVDGHNLYFSCLKGTPYKWLDLETLIGSILECEAPGSDLIRIRYFTSPIKGSFSRRGQVSTDAQSTYIRALRTRPCITVTEGRFLVDGGYAIRHQVPPNRDDKVKIWRIEEKETDVSIALSMYHDAQCESVDQIVLISNDSDMVPALKKIRAETRATIGVILPIRSVPGTATLASRPSAGLANQADWVRPHVLASELERAQFPSCIPTKRKAIRRPSHW